MEKHLKRLAVVTSIGMFLVLLAGALVTKSGSGEGCGDDWPLCNGKFIPAYTIESMIEYSHRAISGIVGLLVLFTALAVWKTMRHRKDALFYAFTALGFTIIQSILGAMAVVWEQSSAVMALHFGISLIAFASTMMLAILLRFLETSSSETSSGFHAAERRSIQHIGKGFRLSVWFTTAYSYFVVYLGAYMRHTETMGGCIGWPLCNGELIPELSGAPGIAFLHRFAAFWLLVFVALMAWMAHARYKGDVSIRKGSRWALVLIIVQILSGAVVALTMDSENYLFSALVHTVIISLLFGTLSYLSVQVSPFRMEGNPKEEMGDA